MRIVQELPGLDGEEAVHCIGGSDLCDLFGISAPMLTQLCKRKVAIRRGRNSYDLEQSTRNYIRPLRETASGRGGEEQVLALTTERARLASAQADAQEMKNAVLRAELVQATEVERGWADILRQVRARILAATSRLRQSIDLNTATATAIDRELRDALSELGHADD